MEKGESNNISQQEQIRRYLSGKMSAAEMHALEKQALEDPFLADAIEGMATVGEDQINADLGDLKSRLAERTKPETVRLPRGVSWRKMSVAAAIIGIAILSTVLLVNRQPETNSLAAAREQELKKRDAVISVEDSATSITGDSGAVAAANSFVSKPVDSQRNAEEVVNKRTEQIPIAVKKAKKEEPEADRKQELSEIVNSDKPQVKADAQSLENKTSGIEVKPSAANSTPSVGVLRSMDDIHKNNSGRLFYFTGQVTNAEQQPVSFANIAIKNANSLTYTDAKGNFRLFSADSVLNVDIKSVGYQTNSVVLNYTEAQHQLVLNSLPLKSKRYKSADKKVTSEMDEPVDSLNQADSAFVSTDPDAEPVDGWGLYHLYLLNNVRHQRGTDGRNIEGNVVVSFLVNNMGWLSDFKVEKSLSPACDREALRLVREGPKWELYNTETPIRVKVTVVF